MEESGDDEQGYGEGGDRFIEGEFKEIEFQGFSEERVGDAGGGCSGTCEVAGGVPTGEENAGENPADDQGGQSGDSGVEWVTAEAGAG